MTAFPLQKRDTVLCRGGCRDKTLEKKPVCLIMESIIEMGRCMDISFLRKIPIVTGALIACNIGIWIILELAGDTRDSLFMIESGASYLPLIVEQGEYWRLFSCMFLHFGADHLMNNMLMLGVTGYRLEKAMGSVRFGILYMGSGLCGSLLSVRQEMGKSEIAVSAGASGAVFGVLGGLIAYAALHKGKVEGLTARGLLGMAALSLYYGVSASGVDNWGHVGGLLGGLLLGAVFSVRKSGGNSDKND